MADLLRLLPVTWLFRLRVDLFRKAHLHTGFRLILQVLFHRVVPHRVDFPPKSAEELERMTMTLRRWFPRFDRERWVDAFLVFYVLVLFAGLLSEWLDLGWFDFLLPR
ncbi:MAG: hypothetical protein A2284_14360 [Deltaproteobacteria bacterium RIFOXYA12_FULL_61_11]|nr:MAG: hypothetical protein A2284_14360 [Deltaproteobacteria bacterium RIFOXYA12_FULL_61_11]